MDIPSQHHIRFVGKTQTKGFLFFIRRHASIIMIIQCMIMIPLTYIRGDELGMKERISHQFLWYYVPSALTYMTGSEPLSYAANGALLNAFTKTYQETESVDAALTAALKAEVYPPSWFVWGNDKGGTLYSLIAFEIFGVNAKAHYKLFFLLLSGSVAFFVLAFRKDPFKIFCLLCLLISLYALAKPFSLGGLQLGAFHAQRALGILAFVPTLHLLFSISNVGSRERVITLVPQALLLVFVYFIRSSAAWAFIALAVLTALALWRALRTHPTARSPHGIFRIAFPCVIPIVCVAGALGLLQLHKQQSLHPRYLSDLVETRVIWHNMYLGTVAFTDLLASDDRLKFAQQLFPTRHFDDAGVQDALKNYLVRNGRSEEWLSLDKKVKDGSVGGMYALANYDRLVREMYFDAWRHFPRELLITYLVSKPVAFAKIFGDIWKEQRTNYFLAEDLGICCGHFYGASPLGAAPLSFFLLSLFIMLALWRAPSRHELIVVAMLAMVAQLGWFLAYPTFQATPESFLAATFFIYVAATLLVIWLILGIGRIGVPTRNEPTDDKVRRQIKYETAHPED